jgi:hypothetical protein
VAAPTQTRLNLGGEGEIADVINQQPECVPSAQHWITVGAHLAPLIAAGEPFLFCRNTDLPFPDGSVDYVFSNSVPVDTNTWLGPGIQSTEVHRILRVGGEWEHDGVLVYTKP